MNKSQRRDLVAQCFQIISDEDRLEIYRLAMTDLEEWKRVFSPKKEYLNKYKSVEFHVVGNSVYCALETID